MPSSSDARRRLAPLTDRGPLRVMFVNTSLPVGGAEMLLAALVRNLDRDRFLPEICCLKELGPLGEQLSGEAPTHAELLGGKFDLRVWPRLTKLFGQRKIDAVITVGAGDKMFWGRLAAASARTPVVLSALHSTGYPDNIQRPNRWLNRWTDGFIAVAPTHGRYLIEVEKLPAEKVFVVPNGVDVAAFQPSAHDDDLRKQLGIPLDAPVAGLVAALRPEKNHSLFLDAARRVLAEKPDARFVIVGDGPLRSSLEQQARQIGLGEAVHFLGNRADVPRLLNMMDVFVLSSRMEANPVSILEAMACGRPVVAPRVGSIPDMVAHGETGFLTTAGDEADLAARMLALFGDRALAARMGAAGREQVVRRASLERMVAGYESLITEIYSAKCEGRAVLRPADDPAPYPPSPEQPVEMTCRET